MPPAEDPGGPGARPPWGRRCGGVLGAVVAAAVAAAVVVWRRPAGARRGPPAVAMASIAAVAAAEPEPEVPSRGPPQQGGG